MNPAAASSALIYARQSQDSKTSTDQQQTEGLARAEEEGWNVHRVYRDGSSASQHATKTRGAWTELLADLALPQVKVVWLWESSRGDRTLTSWSGLLDRCRELGVSIYVETHGRLYDIRNPRDWKTLAEDGVDSAYEVDKSALRIRRSVAAKAKEGQVHGRTPYGYRRQYGIDANGKRVLVGQFPHPEEAKVVRDIALAPVYAGKRQHVAGSKTGHVRRGDDVQLYDGIWEVIVTVEQYNDVHRLLTDPQRRTSRSGRAKHLLSMIATCDVCGGVMIARFVRGEGEYVCRDSGHVRVPQDELDEYVEALLLTRLADPEEYRHLADGDDTGQELQGARDELASIQEHYDGMKDLLRTRRMSPTAFADIEPDVLADLEKATQRLAELETPSQLRTLLGDPDVDQDLYTRWSNATPVAHRTLVRLMFSKIAVTRSPSRGHRSPVSTRVQITPTRSLLAATA